ncbi:MAG: B12-binding domain-containing radical SAM protein [Anaerolineales bacterium]|nr:B12-binding domain-containing radical SAM protein [Anaerolineales bacterium]MCB9128567.1 B12-binding domain-containing radical SAM protein [Ardenticatenales bacterium]MCB9172947.1 B12-binding domain-containing radical SAM protein [Ardenticatenales bacterium]
MPHKIVLYNPKSTFYTMPLALMALGSALDRARFEVQIIDGRLEADPVAAVVAACEEALCLGVTVLSGNPIHDALAVTRAVKAAHPTLPTVWGGWHPSLFPTETLAEPSIDVTVQGQGEVTFGELADRFAAGESVQGVAGIAHRVAEGTVQEAPRPLLPMDALPAHDYSLIDVERYFELKGERQLDYISSTGCFFRCAFCADPFVFKRKWVGLSPARMGEEIELLWRRYHFTDLSFQDETFFTYPNRVAAIAEEFLRRGLRFSWTGTLRADQGHRMDDATLDLCVRAGLRRVMIGVESGSQEMMDWLQKDIKVEQVLESAERCVKHGIGAIFPFIVGFPGESDASVQASLEMVKRLRKMSPQFETPIFYFKPYPGSRITQEVVERGYQLPQTLEEWGDFDYIGSSGPWVSAGTYQRIERFKFYNRFAGGPETWLRRPLQQIARWRCQRDWYHFPIEKLVVERLKPLPSLS